MSSARDSALSEAPVDASPRDFGPYILRSILTAEQLSRDGLENSAITCVEFWSGGPDDDHLYIGTSGGELLHYFRLPASDDDVDGQASFIYASTLQAPFAENAEISPREPGVKQIFIVPNENKACVLCNGTISFYALPELSPIFTSATPNNCTWVGGCDINADHSGHPGENGTTFMMCQKNRLRLVAIGERGPKQVRQVELRGCIDAVRRGNIACVADADSYSLLDVVQLQRFTLAEISSISAEETPASASDQEQAPPNTQGSAERGHRPSASLGTIEGASQPERRSSSSRRTASQQLDPTGFPPRGSSLAVEDPSSRSPSRERPATDAGSNKKQAATSKPVAATEKLWPHIVSPSENEFMFTTGTSYDERGVGMFVSMDGDPVRGTVEFSRYPISLCVDGTGVEAPIEKPEEGYVLALINAAPESTNSKTLEIKRWDVDAADSPLHQLLIPGSAKDTTETPFSSKSGMCSISTSCHVNLPEIIDILATSQLEINGAAAKAEKRAAEERKFVSRLSGTKANLVVWDSNNIWWLLRNPEIIRLDASLLEASNFARLAPGDWINRSVVESTLNEIRGRQESNELEYLSLRDVRQKGSIILFMDILHQTLSKVMTYERDRRVTEEALIEGEVDPRVLLSFVPLLREEVVEGSDGIWVSNGLKQLVQGFMANHNLSVQIDASESSGESILHLIKRYLLFLRKKKGNASMTDEREVFLSVDAAILQVFLILDAKSPPGPARKGSLRADFNAVVDSGIDSFDRAVQLLESHKRLYMLSRLYQSRKMSRNVLATWRRILEGEEDVGKDFVNGEVNVRAYLTKINDAQVVEEYGTWLANRNPSLGIRVFSEPESKITFTPENAVKILKKGAPGAVKYFLEHLVFDNNLAAYADDLIGYYLDSVISELENSDEARSVLLKSYETYRRFKSPKPTYSQFAANLDIQAEWWSNRLRLLQLLGGSHGAASKYDVDGMAKRIGAHEQELVPEMIVLNGRQGKHQQALRLLTHGLGDFDTAVRYCVLGGSSTYSPLAGSLPGEFEPTKEEQEKLFAQLVEEFLKIQDMGERLNQTTGLLERFGSWFDVEHILTLIPDNWSVDLLSRFLQNAFRNLVSERHEAGMVGALASTDNLNANFELIQKREWRKPRLDQVS